MALVFMVGTALMAGCQKPPPALAATKPPAVDIGMPIAQPVTDYEEFTGHTEAVESVELRAQVTGYLKQVHFKDGADVKKDELLFDIDPKTYAAERERFRALVVQAEARLERLNRDYNRLIAGKGSVTQEEIDRITGDRAEAKAAVAVAVAAREVAEQNVEFTKIRAPFAGRISRRAIDAGNLVKANETVLTGIVALDPIYSSFDVDERTLLRLRRLVREGKMPSARVTNVNVDIGLADEEGYSMTGVIDFIDNKVDANTGTLRVRARVSNSKLILSPGLFVRIRLPVGAARPSLLVPEEALGTDQGQKYVFVLNEKDEVVYRAVKIGAQVGRLRVIESGVSAGDRVIFSGLQKVRPGVKVAPRSAEAASSAGRP